MTERESYFYRFVPFRSDSMLFLAEIMSKIELYRYWTYFFRAHSAAHKEQKYDNNKVIRKWLLRKSFPIQFNSIYSIRIHTWLWNAITINSNSSSFVLNSVHATTHVVPLIRLCNKNRSNKSNSIELSSYGQWWRCSGTGKLTDALVNICSNIIIIRYELKLNKCQQHLSHFFSRSVI